jgi:hypothetical protein
MQSMEILMVIYRVMPEARMPTTEGKARGGTPGGRNQNDGAEKSCRRHAKSGATPNQHGAPLFILQKNKTSITRRSWSSVLYDHGRNRSG